MIDRYSLKKMKSLWSDQNKFDNFLKVEIASTKAFSDAGIIPKEDYINMKNNAKFDLKTIYSLEEETKHDVIAFTRCVGMSLGNEKKWFHYGLTSTDVVDTSQSLILKECNNILIDDIDKLLITIKNMAEKYKNTPCIGRTHGMHAEITSFGLKFALFYDELLRNKKRLCEARKDVEVCKLSGAVGNYITTTIDIEKSVSKELGLNRANISTQVLSRDRHAYYIEVLALIASFLEKFATEIRHLARQEVHEVEEYFSSKQKGSSAMPHKRNPISCENICGCARIIKSYVNVALDDNVLWHERDISHSSAERIMLPDSTILLDYMLVRFNGILEKLVVYKEKMMENIYLTYGVIFSGAVLNYLVTKNYTREDAYDLVQPLAFKSINEKRFYGDVLQEEKILSKEEIDLIFTTDNYLKNVDSIYKEVFVEE